jgi:pimeloyl-ACP methyl ester carboxylesterase
MRPAILLTLAAIALRAGAAAQAAARAGEFVTSDGVRIHYLVQGSGPPLVLLHGFALSADINWVGQGTVDSLATAFTVIVPDLRGHGQSDKLHEVSLYGMRFVADVVDLLNHLKIPKAHVAGFSMGGAIALKLAAIYPERVRSAVLSGSGWAPPGAPPPPFAGAWVANLERAARERTSVAQALWPPELPPLPAPLVAGLDRNDAAALVAVLKSLPALDVSEDAVRAMRVPMHAVAGEKDEPVRVEVDALARLAPRLTVTIIPGADHRGTMTDPLLVRSIRDFARAH